MVNALILGRKEQTSELQALLEEKGLVVTVTEKMAEIPKIPQGEEGYRISFITDSFPDAMNVSLLSQVKAACRPECMVCLSEQENHGQERILRSAGLVFLGSYQRFLTFADHIIQTALGATERKESLRKLEERLTNSELHAQRNARRNVIQASMAFGRIMVKAKELLAEQAARFRPADASNSAQ